MAQFRIDRNQYLADGKTIYEVNMLSSRLSATGTMTDAFGRVRIAQPFTLFDSFHRYQDNDKFATSTSGTANTEYLINESAVDMNVGDASGDKCYRESTRVFAYQPGKSLLIMNTFVFNESKTNLRQRVGYFNSNNGIFLEDDGTDLYIVLRSYVSGSVVETRVAQADWNIDKFDGTGSSSQVNPHDHSGGLDVTKSNIFWIDVEWLGVGDVRCGFVVDGLMYPAHIFHNDNLRTTTYMTTAILPIRYEIENTGATASASKLKQICSSVISEGGYEIRGKSRTYGIEPVAASQRALSSAGTYYPVISLQLKSTTLDAIVVPKGISIVPVNSAIYKYQIIQGATIAGANWTSAGATTSVDYNANNSSTMSGGTVLSSGLLNATNQSASTIRLDGDAFLYQLERDGLLGTPTTLTLAMTCGTATCNVVATMDWQEYT